MQKFYVFAKCTPSQRRIDTIHSRKLHEHCRPQTIKLRQKSAQIHAVGKHPQKSQPKHLIQPRPVQLPCGRLQGTGLLKLHDNLRQQLFDLQAKIRKHRLLRQPQRFHQAQKHASLFFQIKHLLRVVVGAEKHVRQQAGGQVSCFVTDKDAKMMHSLCLLTTGIFGAATYKFLQRLCLVFYRGKCL